MKKQAKLKYWVVTDLGVFNCNKKMHDDFISHDRPAFRSQLEALEFAISCLCSRIDDLENKANKAKKAGLK
jgi:hypothetical protein